MQLLSGLPTQEVSLRVVRGAAAVAAVRVPDDAFASGAGNVNVMSLGAGLAVT